MTPARSKRRAAVPATICLASGLILLLATGPLAPSAAAQSAGEEKLRSALLGLQHEFPDTVVEITPKMLSLQKEVVQNLGISLQYAKADVATAEDLLRAQLAYLREVEALRVMEARSSKTPVSEKELLKIRIEIRSDALSHLKRYSQTVQVRAEVQEMTAGDVAAARAAALKAEIALEALKAAAR
jgi:hypothetical protein